MKYMVLFFISFSSLAALSPREQKRYERMRIMVNERVIMDLAGEKPIRAFQYVKGKAEYMVESLNCKALVKIKYKDCDGQRRGRIWEGPRCFKIKSESLDMGGCKKIKSCTALLKRDGKCW